MIQEIEFKHHDHHHEPFTAKVAQIPECKRCNSADWRILTVAHYCHLIPIRTACEDRLKTSSLPSWSTDHLSPPAPNPTLASLNTTSNQITALYATLQSPIPAKDQSPVYHQDSTTSPSAKYCETFRPTTKISPQATISECKTQYQRHSLPVTYDHPNARLLFLYRVPLQQSYFRVSSLVNVCSTDVL